MSLKFLLVHRKDMTKGAPADRKLYYGLTRVSIRLDLEKLCDAIASRSTASRGDIKLVLEGLIYEMCSKLTEGYSISLGTFGTFRITNGSKGVATPEEFNASMFNKGRITFSAGTMLRGALKDLKYEKMQVVTVEEKCDKEHVY